MPTLDDDGIRMLVTITIVVVVLMLTVIIAFGNPKVQHAKSGHEIR